VLLIFKLGLQRNFFSNYWLWIGILLFAAILYLSVAVSNPSVEKMIKMAKAGEMGPEFGRLAKRVGSVGPVVGIMFVTVAVLMIWKPGFTF
jgi:diacylglycerol kinase